MARRTAARRLLGLVVAVAVLAGPVLRVAIDADAHHDGRDRVEASHDAEHCRALHDHRACLLLFASSAAPAEPATSSAGDARSEPAGVAHDDPHRMPEPHRPGLPRAPPTLSV